MFFTNPLDKCILFKFSEPFQKRLSPTLQVKTETVAEIYCAPLKVSRNIILIKSGVKETLVFQTTHFQEVHLSYKTCNPSNIVLHFIIGTGDYQHANSSGLKKERMHLGRNIGQNYCDKKIDFM